MSIPEPATPRILIIDDNAASINVIARALAPEFGCEFALSGQEALARLTTGELPDLILLDLIMPEMDGEEVLHRLKSDLHTHDIPVIVITASNDPASEASALLAGAADFIHKPINPQVVRLRVGLHILLREREHKLSQIQQEIKDLAFYDPLTGLPNRCLLMDRLQNCTRLQDARAMLCIDLDHLKSVNDTLGDAMGDLDLLLQQVARRLTGCVRKHDTAVRLEGDKFMVVLTHISGPPEVIAAHARIVGEKILATLNAPYRLGDQDHSITASIGIALFDNNQTAVEDLLKRADLAMYRAKVGGHNRLCFFDPAMQSSPDADRT
ncbi:diguanylate cyclase [uncultured Thiodictyon sp.]|uniref:diguanylate cyclase domain-containing protein n=1 Tax=uncultured Thiodictyon sp. TaxID=1846217 RepID=UPI0025EE8795|nr:diguanylate cyclase [uncultured Thiodictyon sp.]